MDVRCEKCMTVYEFDDSQVGENGVTVKCTQCGNLFKVKRRSTTAELALVSGARTPSWTPPLPPTPRPRIPPPPHLISDTARLGISIDDLEEIPAARNRGPILTLVIGLGVIVLAGSGYALRGKLFGGADAGRAREQYTQGRSLF